ncbi:pantoate--beta-alanine ligase [Desulfonatronospira sp.]|uniref:pantoate--beta-alanine ligase n=1 Tax=Desulfonatronospira sp. TaxID=1962951 RepID=UPI0025C3B6F4|nr:pantoate--beta-alanine ligase [Desulfonatronospira sp.]
MEIISSCSQIQQTCMQARQSGRTLALVPTMGYFHDGHLSLMRWAREYCDMLVVSLFVNPAQFGPGEDYQRYPQDLDNDVHAAMEEGVDILFTPARSSLYPDGFSTWVEVQGLSGKLCGLTRPEHFRGVTTVVCKLFNLTCPHKAVFGQKDWQQLIIIKKMTRDLNMPVEIVGRPTVREDDGLAMSSRNAYLDQELRKVAPRVYQGLLMVRGRFESGQDDRLELELELRSYYQRNLPQAEIDYVQIVDSNNLEPQDRVKPGALAAVALKLGQARLIDNILLD